MKTLDQLRAEHEAARLAYANAAAAVMLSRTPENVRIRNAASARMRDALAALLTSQQKPSEGVGVTDRIMLDGVPGTVEAFFEQDGVTVMAVKLDNGTVQGVDFTRYSAHRWQIIPKMALALALLAFCGLEARAGCESQQAALQAATARVQRNVLVSLLPGTSDALAQAQTELQRAAVARVQCDLNQRRGK